MPNIIRRNNLTIAKVGDHEVVIPEEFLNDFSALAILASIPGNKTWDIFACFFEAGSEHGQEKIRQRLRPLVDNLCISAHEAVSAMKEVAESFK